MARPDKSAAVAELAEQFRSSNAAVLTEYRGLTVAQLKELRTALGANASYAVVKNTLTKIAVKEAGVEGLTDLLVGPSAIAFISGDPVEAAKSLRDFAKDNPLLVIKGGVLDGAPLTADEIKKLASLESREVLLAKLARAKVEADPSNSAPAAAPAPAEVDEPTESAEPVEAVAETEEVVSSPESSEAEAPAEAAETAEETPQG